MDSFVNVDLDWLEGQKRLAARKYPLHKVIYRKLFKSPIHRIIHRF